MIEPTPQTQRYWNALAVGRLTGERCTACGTTQAYPRRFCERCGAESREVVEFSGRGTIYSFSVVTRTPPGFHLEAPFAVALIDLDEGQRILASIPGEVDSLQIGARVQLSSTGDNMPAAPCFEAA